MQDGFVEKKIHEILMYYNCTDENFSDTPQRFKKVLECCLRGKAPKLPTFPLQGKASLILIKEYIGWSFCPHHLLPVKYTFKVGYIPHRRVLGLSKLGRIADFALIGFPLQEEVADRVVQMIEDAIDPKGSGCIAVGEHLCMRMRGVKQPCVIAVSSCFRGVLLTEPSTKEEFLNL